MSADQLVQQAKDKNHGVRLRALGAMLRERARSLNASLAAHQPQKLEDIYKKYGIERPEWQEAPAPTVIEDVREFAPTADKRTALALYSAIKHEKAAALAARVRLANSLGKETPTGEIGTPGTPIYSGIIAVEPTARMSPYLARGYAGHSGIFEKLLREPLVYQACESIKQVLVGGDWHMTYPKDTPEELRRSVEEAGDWAWGMLLNLYDSWPQYVEDASSTVPFGFSTFEPVWGRPDTYGRTPITRLGYREQSTVERWLMSARSAQLLAVHYQTGAESSYSYVLPAFGEALQDHKVLLNRIGGRGNNFEGLSPLRTIEPIVTLKHLLIQIIAATSERFGSPLLTSRTDTALLQQGKGFAAKEDDLDAFLDDMIEFVAMDTPFAHVPPGLILEYVGAKGEMPEFIDTLKYLDSQIELAFNNQGALLGQQGVGSYALSQTQDNAFLRSAPYYAHACVTKSLNQLLRRIFMAPPFSLRLRHYPEVAWRLGGTGTDASKWLADLKTLSEIAHKLPPEALKAAVEKLDLSPDTFTDLAAQAKQGVVEDQQRVYKITNALKSGIVARTPDVVRALHDLLDLPAPTDEQIAALLQQTVPGAPQDPDVVDPAEVA